MSVPTPHFLLFSEATSAKRHSEQAYGQWRFVLEDVDGSSSLAVSDHEPDAQGERLELLAVIRGLEALERPSRVTLVTASRYVSRGIRRSLEQWRESDWRWERFGQMVPINHGDLWKRIDKALQYHQVNCRAWRFDPSIETDGESAMVADEPQVSHQPLPVEAEPKQLESVTLSRFAQDIYHWFLWPMSYLTEIFKRRTETSPAA